MSGEIKRALDAATMPRHLLRAVSTPETTREEWHGIRAGGVTASEAHDIANGGRGTHKRIRAEKLAGAGFRGNAHTSRGNEREPFLLQWANDFVSQCFPSSLIFAHPGNLRHMATPDGFGFGATPAESFGVEVKSHDHTWTSGEIPEDHYDQMQFGMWVTGFDRWLYLWEVMGEDGRPTLEDPQYRWVARDEARIGRLVSEADRFLAWWDAGAPDHDNLADELDDALADYAHGLRLGREAEALKKPSRVTVAAEVARIAEASGDDVVKLAGTRAALVWKVDTVDVLDKDAWAEGDPEQYAEWEDARIRAADATSHYLALEREALARFHKPQQTESMTIRGNKEPKAA